VTESNDATPESAAPAEGIDNGAAPAATEAAPGLAESSLSKEELTAKVAGLTAQRLKDEHERLLRTAAEFDNFKKRALKEKDDVRKFGVESLLKDFLPVSDNLDRALDHAEQHDPKQVIEGVRLVQKMLEGALSKHGVIGFSALGQMFDPAQHEALMQAESDQPPGTVIQEMARGYRLAERLVRPAAVVVARAKEGSSVDPDAKPN
jgi:molecular chaperone GrpE